MSLPIAAFRDNAYTPANASFNGDASTPSDKTADGTTWRSLYGAYRRNSLVSLSLSLSLFISFIHYYIHAYMCLTVGRRSRDLRPLSRDRSVTFSEFFQIAWNVEKKRCLTVGRRSRDLRPLSRDRSVTFFTNFPNCLKRPRNIVWQSAAWPPTTVAWPFSDFLQKVF